MAQSERYPYGAGHRKARAKALKQLQAGAPCPFCSRPMYPEQDLDLDHRVPLVMGDVRGELRLSHASCNRSAGAKLGNQLRRKGPRPTSPAPVPATPPKPGAPCYDCGQPMEAGQRLQSGPAAYGGHAVWSHVRCETRFASVPADRL